MTSNPSQYQAIHSKELPACSNVTHWEPDYESPISEDGVTFRFGLIVCVGGLAGVVSGMITSVKLRSKEGFLIFKNTISVQSSYISVTMG